MAAAEILLKTNFLSDAAHLLRFAAPETSAYLMSDCADHLSKQGSCVSDIYRQHVCTACGHIMIPGHATELRLEARRSCRQKSTSHRNGAVTAPTSPSKILACGHCKSVTRIRLAAPDKAARTKASRSKNETIPGPSIEKPKPNTNASSKKRAKNRKAGLQALLSSQQKPSAGLSLASFMK
ncbi:RNAse P Rpr2/Rpp21/SNM1 subunit domain-containing protein [Beauveria bassiana ARSEF 2860]|uniref:RNAse P Rpr2/Rpp21/SNM1 subunit domain-containing protein n=1 Tax=Beauveria bassiana (strain ARSEF 2860) TaxID=655819 RepID=J5JN33_BEAB2|nr:RNAse P Rpr2/Rpp21/SNM1 subunit domain-containing protein [Beauveria bassiana ARSEF 2860]EJP66648.1 RNAse P Rpr2/Rpp21/SNM1 subunit domain-containing protein [Beauveria bassiana ARSEF 2860]